MRYGFNVKKPPLTFIPKDKYLKIYNALFKSHISNCISSWDGVSEYKLKTLFSVQKRCVRL